MPYKSGQINRYGGGPGPEGDSPPIPMDPRHWNETLAPWVRSRQKGRPENYATDRDRMAAEEYREKILEAQERWTEEDERRKDKLRQMMETSSVATPAEKLQAEILDYDESINQVREWIDSGQAADPEEAERLLKIMIDARDVMKNSLYELEDQ